MHRSGQILAQLLQTGAIVIAQDNHIGAIHVRQQRVVLNAVIPHHQHSYLLIFEGNSVQLTERPVRNRSHIGQRSCSVGDGGYALTGHPPRGMILSRRLRFAVFPFTARF
jgi:hypothetical protein